MKPNLLFAQVPTNGGANEAANSSFRKANPLVKQCPFENDLIKDLNLHEIFNAMSQGNSFLYKTAKEVMMEVVIDVETIAYRQDILKDCIRRKSVIQEFFSIASAALKEGAYYKEYTQASFSRIIPVSVRLYNSVCLLEVLVRKLEGLRTVIKAVRDCVKSKGLIDFCNRFEELLSKEFFSRVKIYISDLKSINDGNSLVLSSSIGNGLKGDCHILRKISKDDNAGKKENKRILPKSLPFNVIPLDNSNIINDAQEMEDAALVHMLRAINQFTGSIVHFFEELRFEAGFYTGCVNLYESLVSIGAPVSFPIPKEISDVTLVFDKLYDVGLAVQNSRPPVTNSLKAQGKTLFIITGANQGGKSTFLRSLGLAQLFMQCGAFVPAEYFSSNVTDCIFTHFTREEDAGMNSGKLDEELSRVNDIVNNISSCSTVLMNEPFATTTERDGSSIAADIVSAFYESGIKVFFVTHLYEFASSFHDMGLEKALFLKAERNEDGSRSYSIKEGMPLRTSYGEDLFREIFDKQAQQHNKLQLLIN